MTGVINDPLCQTHSLASSEHCFCGLWIGLVDQYLPDEPDDELPVFSMNGVLSKESIGLWEAGKTTIGCS